MSDDNIISFGTIKGDKADKEFPSRTYVIVDVDDIEYEYEGYLIFTTHHVCIMEEDGDNNPITGFMMPMHRVKLVSLADDEVETVN